MGAAPEALAPFLWICSRHPTYDDVRNVRMRNLRIRQADLSERSKLKPMRDNLFPYETSLPRINDRRVGALVIARIAGQDRQPVAECRRRDDQIGLRECMPRLAAFLDQQPPFEHDVFGDGQDALLEHRPHPVREPIVECDALAGVGNKLNAEADFGETHSADIEFFECLLGDEGKHFRLGFWAAQLRENIRVEQPTRHRSTPRTGIRPRFGSMSMSREGGACIAAMSASPLRSPLRRRNSSAETTTTSSRPCTVTC